MDTLIYLDQNTLSELRVRKLEERNDPVFVLLKQVMLVPNVQLVYSHVTLEEINQISVEDFKKEHVDLLEELDGRYIEPLFKTIGTRSPSQVWDDFCENLIENQKAGISDLSRVSELSTRKLSGLPIEENFEDINDSLKTSLKTLLDGCLEQLGNFDIEELEEPLRSHFMNMKAQLPELQARADSLIALPISDNQQLGPKPFRELTQLKIPNIERLSVSQIVKTLEDIFETENTSFKWTDYFEDSQQNRVSKAYTLMNWAGYHADDFDKVTKKGDRFRASNNDMMHAIMAMGAAFLLSNDNAFCKKAMACYAYAGVNTIVCSPQTFLRKYCKRKCKPLACI